MSEPVIIVEREGTALDLMRADFVSEDDLQQLLAARPEILAGRQAGGARPPHFALIAREEGIPDSPDGWDRWSIDHVFVDEEAVPTLVEVKRSGDTRIRREVVGQLLDYAANAVVHWPAGRMRASFEATCKKGDLDADHEVERLAGESLQSTSATTDDPVGTFWSQVDTNLAQGNLRLVFLSDAIPTELQRIIEFLNEQMTHTEVLGISVARFTAEELTVIVPTVVGQTAAADLVKHGSASRSAGLGELLSSDQVARDALQVIRTWATGEGLIERPQNASIEFLLPGGVYPVVYFYPGVKHKVSLDFESIHDLVEVPRLHNLLKEIVSPNVTAKWPGLRLDGLTDYWDRLGTEFFPDYLAAHRRLAVTTTES